MQFRRSDFDVTNTVQVSSVASVRKAVEDLYQQTWPRADFAQLTQAFADFERLFQGSYPGYLGCDTVYHDMQHSLDDTLAMARLIAGHDRSQTPDQRLGAERALVALIVALFHDSGYIRHSDDTLHRNGAEYTRTHVARGATFLTHYLPVVGLADWVPIATQVIHFTGYEVPFKDIHLDDARDRRVGHLLGTADMLAQMSDRCYLEKCRDRLYPEFVLGGMAMQRAEDGGLKVHYASGLDVLRRTPEFAEATIRTRLDGEFNGAYRYLECLFGGRNPYMDAIHRNLDYLAHVLETGNWRLLRRLPPVFTWSKNPVETVRSLVIQHIQLRLKAV